MFMNKNNNLKLKIKRELKSKKGKYPKGYFDLENRTANFGENIIQLVKSIPHKPTNNIVSNQLIRSGTSIGANYMEADCGSSKRDFRHKISLCRKESKETKHWLRMLARSCPLVKERCRFLWQEAHELTCIFSAILGS